MGRSSILRKERSRKARRRRSSSIVVSRRPVHIFLLVVVVLLVLATLFFAAQTVGAQAPVPQEPKDPMGYVVNGKFAVVASMEVSLDGEVLADNQLIEGKSIWQSATEISDGEHVILPSEGISETVTTADLVLEETYANTELGVTITANNETWGRTGVVVYPASDGMIAISITGWGYSVELPTGTEWWDGYTWVTSGVWGYYTIVRVPEPVVPVEPQDPMAFMVDGKFSAVASMEVSLDGETLTNAVFYEGRRLLQSASEVADGLHNFVGSSSQSVTTADLLQGEEYVDAELGLNISASSGRVGIVVFPPVDGSYVISITGLGYDSAFPEGTESWDGASWVSTVAWGYYTIIRVPVPVGIYHAFIPYLESTSATQPAGCVPSAPFTPIYWQFDSGLGICSSSQPESVNGITATAFSTDYANWQYLGHVPGWVTQGSSYNGTLMSFSAHTSPIGVFEHPGVVVAHTPAFAAVYTINGSGYNTVQTDWGDQLWFWDFAAKTWTKEAKWGTFTVIAVEDK